MNDILIFPKCNVCAVKSGGLLIGAEDPRIPNHESKTTKLNVFALELFSVQKGTDVRRDKEFLQVAFECFPNVEYCILLRPSTAPFFPLLRHFVVSLLIESYFRLTFFVLF